MPTAWCDVWWGSTALATGQLTSLLPGADWARISSYRRPEDRDRGLVTAVLSRLVLADLVGASPFELDIVRTCARCGGPHGKPRLAGADVEFSVAHSGDWVAVAVTLGMPVGIDVETVGQNPAGADLVRTVLTNQEVAALPASEDPRGFLRYWVRKEAVLKAVGTGLRTPPDSFAVSAPNALARLLTWPADPTLPDSTTLADLGDRGGHIASIAVLRAGVGVRERDGGALLREADRWSRRSDAVVHPAVVAGHDRPTQPAGAEQRKNGTAWSWTAGTPFEELDSAAHDMLRGQRAADHEARIHWAFEPDEERRRRLGLLADAGRACPAATTFGRRVRRPQPRWRRGPWTRSSMR